MSNKSVPKEVKAAIRAEKKLPSICGGMKPPEPPKAKSGTKKK